MKRKALKAAFPLTIPVMTGFMFLGTAYGFLMNSKGFGLGITALTSATVFAGSMQYAGVALLTSIFNPIYALLITLMVNARHAFYGLSMLEKYKGIKSMKPFLIFGLVDETFSINYATALPEGVAKDWFYFFVTLLNYIYWVMACCVGNFIGNLFIVDTRGLDFVLTAFFVVIFLNQWNEQKNHIPALIGVISSIVCLILFGKDGFIIPAMLLMIVAIFIFKPHIEKEDEQHDFEFDTGIDNHCNDGYRHYDN